MTNKTSKNSTTENFDVLALLMQLWEGRKTLALFALVFTCIAFFATKFIDPSYKLTNVIEQQTSNKLNQSINKIYFLLEAGELGEHSRTSLQQLSLEIVKRKLGQIVVNDESDPNRLLDFNLVVDEHVAFAIKVKIKTSTPDNSDKFIRTLFNETNREIASHLLEEITYEIEHFNFMKASSLDILKNQLSASLSTLSPNDYQREQTAEITSATEQKSTLYEADSAANKDGKKTEVINNQRSELTAPHPLLTVQLSQQQLRAKILELENSPIPALLEAEKRTLKAELDNFFPYVLPEKFQFVKVRQDKELITMVGLFGFFIGAVFVIVRNSLRDSSQTVGESKLI